MMLYPTMPELLKQVSNSRYLLVNVIAKRAREIVAGDEPRNSGGANKPVTMALQELNEDKITYEQTSDGIK